MKYLSFLLIFNLFIFTGILKSQSFTFHGGFKPNSLKGSHFSVKTDLIKSKRLIYSINYTLVKYTDSYAQPNISQPNFHLENNKDRTFINFPELNRGNIIQFQERDFRPSSLNHRFSLFLGYEFLNTSSFLVQSYIGPHIGFSRTIQHYIAYKYAEVIVNEGDSIKILPYHDYQIYRYWDIGFGMRINAEYKVFRNLNLGLSGQIYNDIIGGAIDLIMGGGITYNFN